MPSKTHATGGLGIGCSEEQAALLEVATQYCREKSPPGKVRELMGGELGHDPAIWEEIGELGWLSIAVPERFGGAGLGVAEAVPVIEQMGRRLMAVPFVSTTLAAQALIAGGTSEQKSEILPRICGGNAVTVALSEAGGDWDLHNVRSEATRTSDTLVLCGTKRGVTDAAVASWIVASVRLDGAPALVIIDTASLPNAALRREKIVDETQRSFELRMDGIRVPTSALLDVDRAPATLDRLDRAARLLLAGEMCGGTQGVIDLTLEYLSSRRQFGRLIGSYQALKHPIVEAYVGYEKARSLLYGAAHGFEAGGEVASRMAKAQADVAFAYASDRAIQFHGAFGFTYDCDAQLYRRRAIFDGARFGDAAYHRAKLAERLL